MKISMPVPPRAVPCHPVWVHAARVTPEPAQAAAEGEGRRPLLSTLARVTARFGNGGPCLRAASRNETKRRTVGRTESAADCRRDHGAERAHLGLFDVGVSGVSNCQVRLWIPDHAAVVTHAYRPQLGPSGTD